MSDTNPEMVPTVKADPEKTVEYLKKCRAALRKLECTPMASHETRIIKEAMLVLFAPAFAEMEERGDLDEEETAGEKPLPVYPPR